MPLKKRNNYYFVDAADEVKRVSINSRRYLGNKYKLNDFIKSIIDKECGDIKVFADLFAGTGAVASVFQDKQLILNDILYSNYVSYDCWFGNEEYSDAKLMDFIYQYNNFLPVEENYFSKHYSDTYFNKKNCRKIGFIREDIERNYNQHNINQRERNILITSLLYAMDKISNTCGHYDSYRRNGNLEKELILGIPVINQTKPVNKIYNEDATELAARIVADVVYLDPPYNSRQYCDAYHLLENVACWKKPEVFGCARKMDRSLLKSEYCTVNAADTFKRLIKNINSRYIVLSYNNMAKKGVTRSNAKMSDNDILRILKTQGEVEIFTQDYKVFSTGKSETRDNTERLFVCRCK